MFNIQNGYQLPPPPAATGATPQPFSSFDAPRAMALSIAVIATTFLGFVSPPTKVVSLFSEFSGPVKPKNQAQAAWLNTPFLPQQPAVVFTKFSEPAPQRQNQFGFPNAPVFRPLTFAINFSSFDQLRPRINPLLGDWRWSPFIPLVIPPSFIGFTPFDVPRALVLRSIDQPTPTPFIPAVIPASVTFYGFAQFSLPLRPTQTTLGGFQSFIPYIIPFIPPPPGPTAQKIIALDAAYGSADVERFYRVSLLSQVVVGDPVAILIEVGEQLDPTQSMSVLFTKPDGTTFVVSSPVVYVGRPSAFTGKGIYAPGTYAVCVLTSAQVDQHGIWSAYLQAGVFASAARKFYIGPPAVLV